MINNNSVNYIKSWFDSYIKSFLFGGKEFNEAINIKTQHTIRVCKEIEKIAQHLNLPPDKINIAKIIALLHDTGRFEQFKKYGIYSDSKSENHALLGIQIIKKEHVLEIFDKPIQELIIKTIGYHNHAKLPNDESKSCILFTKG